MRMMIAQFVDSKEGRKRKGENQQCRKLERLWRKLIVRNGSETFKHLNF